MKDPDQLYETLSELLDEYKNKFIIRFLPVDPQVGPDEYELDIKAYCLMSHAAFEEYYEQIALIVMKISIDYWLLHRISSDSAIMLISRYGLSYDLPEEDEVQETKVYDHIRLMLEKAKSRFSTDVYNSHGASPKHLRSLLIPVGIDFLPDPISSNSMIQLAKQRGTYAHHGFARSVLSPEDAVKYVEDCLKFAKEISNKVKHKAQGGAIKYLGTVKKEKGQVMMPDTFQEVEDGRVFEAIEIGGDILLLAGPLEKERLVRIEELAKESIKKHRATLEVLAR